jgi:hypothetical protein
MLSDILLEVEAKLKEEALHYTTGVFAGTYSKRTRAELDEIIEKIEALRIRLDRAGR